MTGPRILKKLAGSKYLYVRSDGKVVEAGVAEMARDADMNENTLRSRIDVLDLEDPAIFYPGSRRVKKGQAALNPNQLANRISRKLYKEWNRKNCRRGLDKCVKYAHCQNKRLGIAEEKWVPPESTDECFIAEKPNFNPYPCWLANSWRLSLPGIR
jgi:hypothetical protein